MPHTLDSEQLALFSQAQLLITESQEDFASLIAALTQEIEPRGIIERMYTAETAYYVWEILRWRRCKTAVINASFARVLKEILRRLIGYSSVGNLVDDWFLEREAKATVSEILACWNLNESIIEAEAIQESDTDVERFDRMLSLAESRRDRALRHVEERQGRRFAKQLREVSDRVIEGEAVVQLENRPAK
jgi:hypothetical protein